MPPKNKKPPTINNPQDLNLVKCLYCDFVGRPQGMGSHQLHCAKRPGRVQDNEQIRNAFGAVLEHECQSRAAAVQSALHPGTVPAFGHDMPIIEDSEDPDSMDAQFTLDRVIDNDCNLADEASGADNPEGPHNVNDIKVETHPSANVAEGIYTFEDYYGGDDNEDLQPADQLNPTPWLAFGTRLNFEMAEVMQSAHLNHREIETILSIVQRAIQSPGEFTLSSFTQLKGCWNAARSIHAEGFERRTVTVTYQDDTLEFEVYMRPLWLWCRELLRDPNLVRQFQWNAERIYKFNGDTFERFFDEPWTADGWWEFQSSPRLPKGALPFFIILYADKTRLSSFGTEKGYPVLVRCANLPIDIRNSTGPGGGRLVGWLPIATDTAADTRRKEYVKMKRILWHKAMDEIIGSIKPLGDYGLTLECGDNVTRTVFPHILMISADYEEQVMIALTRGVNAHKPCPVCLVDGEKLSKIPCVNVPLRTTSTMREAFNHAQGLRLAADREEYLQSYGLRDTENVFWSFTDTDVYQALCFDVLHAYDSGLFKAHLLEVLKELLKTIRNAEGRVETALSEMPPWPGLNHFTSLNTGEMADGSKFEDLSKVILFATVHVLTPAASRVGFLLLRLIRSYLELRMYASLTVHTTSTISAGESELAGFGNALSNYVTAAATGEEGDKSWNFPKIHTHTHMFRDILRKGATRNYNTKPNEKANGPLKKYYQRRTNFKEVAGQILRVNEMDIVSGIIRSQIDMLEEARNISPDVTQQNEDRRPSRNIVGNDHFQLGSPLPPLTLQQIEEVNSSNPIFTAFRRRLSQFFCQLLNKRTFRLDASHQITPYQFIKVFYRSVVDMNIEKDIIRTNPCFYKKERFDCAILQTGMSNFKEGTTQETDNSREDRRMQCILVKLYYMFSIVLEDKTYYLALAQPLDLPRAMMNRGRDKILRITRVRPRARANCVFVHVDNLICGAFLAKDGESAEGEFLVNHFIDQDMWMRLRPDSDHIELMTNVRL